MSDLLGIKQVSKQLLDSKADSRRRATQTITNNTTMVFEAGSTERSCRIITDELERMSREFLKVSAAPYRRAGLAVIRAVACGIPDKAELPGGFVFHVSSMAFQNVTDVDPLVRIGAAEACHALVRSFRLQLIEVNFAELFRALACFINDSDSRVTLLGEEVSATVRELVRGNATVQLDLPLFVALARDVLEPFGSRSSSSPRAGAESPLVPWVLEWLRQVLDMPGHHLAVHLPELLPTLLYLSAGTGDPGVANLLRVFRAHVGGDRAARVSLSPALLLILSSAVERIDDTPTRKLALLWMEDLLRCGTGENRGEGEEEDLLGSLAVVVESVLPQFGSRDAETRHAGQRVNACVIDIAARSLDWAKHADAVIDALIRCAKGTSSEEARVAVLEWFVVVSQTQGERARARFEDLFDSNLEFLCDPSENVVHKALETLCLTAGVPDRFEHFIRRFLQLLYDNAAILLPRLPTVLCEIQSRLLFADGSVWRAEDLLIAVATALPTNPDVRFVSKCIVTINLMLLTGPEFAGLREVLKRGDTDTRSVDAFLALSGGWRYNAVALLSLCLLFRAYESAFAICRVIGESEVSPSTLLQLDRLVQLLEAPVFTYVRTALLQPSQCLPLAQTLFALMMILPQSSPQHAALYNRLRCVPGLSQLESEVRQVCARGAPDAELSPIDMSHIIERFQDAQNALARYEQEELQ